MAHIDVDKVRFTPVRLREGYDMGEVDAHLDLVQSTLTALDAAVEGRGPLPGVLPAPRFTPVRLREGYDIAEVDAFLGQVTEEETRLRRLAGARITPAPSPETDPVVDPSAPAEVIDVSAPPVATGADGAAAYPQLIQQKSSGATAAVIAGLLVLAILVVLLLAL
jgi:DivIVA domain-containing protein